MYCDALSGADLPQVATDFPVLTWRCRAASEAILRLVIHAYEDGVEKPGLLPTYPICTYPTYTHCSIYTYPVYHIAWSFTYPIYTYPIYTHRPIETYPTYAHRPIYIYPVYSHHPIYTYPI
eukprot:1992223-Rhodomonas_salina.2